MDRRALLVIIGAAISAGCLDDGFGGEANGDDNVSENDTHRNKWGSDGYYLSVHFIEDDIGDQFYCNFSDLPENIQSEIQEVIEKEKAEGKPVFYGSDVPEFLEHECYSDPIKYEGEYYLLGVDAWGG